MRAFLTAAAMMVVTTFATPSAWAADLPLGFAVSGVVADVKVTVGTKVEKGNALASLDLKPFLAKKRAADAAVKANKTIFELADLRYNQTQELFDALSTSAENVEIAQTARAQALLAYENARRDATLAAWELDRATLKAPFAGTVSAIHGYAGMVVNVDAGTPTVVVVETP